MKRKISFILNNKVVEEEISEGTVLLDFIRDNKGLKGTKEACREGDCGSCTVLLGELSGNTIQYITINSCLYPIYKVNNKHVMTIEGLNSPELTNLQNSFVDEGAVQCGYCTPGFIVALTGYLLNSVNPSYENALLSISGNICRCTGYESIKRVVRKLNSAALNKKMDRLNFLVSENFLPDYLIEIPPKLKSIQNADKQNGKFTFKKQFKFAGGGTDLFVQIPDKIKDYHLIFLENPEMNKIHKNGNTISFGGKVTFEDLKKSGELKKYIPDLEKIFDLMASLHIRNSATLAGNLANASPIGDLSIFFLALNAAIYLKKGENLRKVFLKNFFRGYKKLDLKTKEYIHHLEIKIPNANSKFSFEKISKRKFLDIASVNTACCTEILYDTIVTASISAGGIAPIPLYLEQTSEYFAGRSISEINFAKISDLIHKEISPISDIRGSAEYKELLLIQLIKAHLLKFFSEKVSKVI